MKFFLDFFPVAIFVGVYVLSGNEMHPAVMALMVGTIVQNIGTRLLTGKFEKLHLWTLGITLVFGGMTLFFENSTFMFWKASIVLWVMAAVFLYRQHVIGKIILQEMFSKAFDEEISAPKSVWQKLNHSWAFSYVVIGFVNLYIAYNFSEAFWVQFKLFGLMGLNILLLIFTMTKIYPYLPLEEVEENKGDAEPKLTSEIASATETAKED